MTTAPEATRGGTVRKVHPEVWEAGMQIASGIIPRTRTSSAQTASLIQRVSFTEVVVHNSPEAAKAART